MNWIVFAFISYFFLGMDAGLCGFFEVHVGTHEVSPSFVLILITFIAFMAPTLPALWAGLILGLLLDLTGNYSGAVVIGPYALGSVLGVALILQIRSIIYRRHPLTLTLLTFSGGMLMQLLAIFLISVRSLFGSWFEVYEAFEWSTMTALSDGFLMVLYSALLALPIGWGLHRTSPIFGFASHGRMRQGR